MNQDADMKSLLDVAEQTVAAAGCASLITMDEAGLPSSRPVADYPLDPGFSRIVIGSDMRGAPVLRTGANSLARECPIWVLGV